MTEKTAFISIIGCPNVGKSSILNRILGSKIAIVSEKPQTTRTKIMGVLTDNDGTQLVFTDTPGFHRPHNKLGEKMIKAVGESISGVDACLLVVEPSGELKPAEEELLKKIKAGKIPTVLAINKTDTVAEKENLLARIMQFSVLYDFEAIVPVSAVTGDGIDELLDELKKLSTRSLERCLGKGINDFEALKIRLREDLASVITQRTKRKPVIIPVIVEADI